MITLFRNQRGQTMIELLVGIGLTAIILLAMALLSTRAIQLSEVSSNRQKAVGLATEGIEDIRRLRNEQYWSDFITGVNNASPTLYQQSVFESIFTRSIYRQIITPANDQVEVTVNVTWQDVKGTHTVTQKTILTDWKITN